jgi:hypothetical protein
LFVFQVNNLNLWRFYRSDTIEKMYECELRQTDEAFQTQKIDFKLKLLSTYNDKRRYLDYEQQHINIRHHHHHLDNEQFMLNRTTNINELILFDGQSTESTQQQQQRPTYNLRRAANDLISDNCSTPTTTSSLQNLSIFSRSNSLLPPFGGIELQRCL